jgi:endonuclease/exonuclease/phosphatase family metal-dependent hydrolase
VRREPVALQLARALEQPLELLARKLLAGEEVTRHPRIVVRAVTWNLFHGRASPPSPKRSLLPEFVEVLNELDWHVALLQEAPPRWRDELARELHAESAIALTSRNFGAPARAWIADRRPNLIKSNEGGSNQLLVRAPWRIAETRELTVARLPERRRMLWARLDGPGELAVANLHGSVDSVRGASAQVLRAAAQAVEWAGDLPLLFGGDLNLRPTRQPDVFLELERRFDLRAPTAPDAIDHLLARRLDILEPPRLGPALPLSDHAYVTTAVGI